MGAFHRHGHHRRRRHGHGVPRQGNDGGEPSSSGKFTVTQSTTSSTDTVVSYTVSGTATAGADYTTLSGTVTILAGQTTADIDVAVLDDTLVEGSESVVVTLGSITSSNPGISIDSAAGTATVTIADDDTATVSLANAGDAAEPGTSGKFTVTQRPPAPPTRWSATRSAAPRPRADYTTLSGTVTILAGQTTADIDVAVLDDTLVEGSENAAVTLGSTTSSNPGISIDTAAGTATVTIADNERPRCPSPMPAMPLNRGTAASSRSRRPPPAPPTRWSATRSGTATAGSDYTTLSGTVTILAGETTADIDVAVLDDTLVEGSESVVVTLGSITSSNPGISIDSAAGTATVTIADNDTATVSLANAGDAAEPGTSGKFTVTQSTTSSTDTVVSYTVSGTATGGGLHHPRGR